MEDIHQLARNSARQIRITEHYKFENACQFCSSEQAPFSRFKAKKRPSHVILPP
jgi:hypothetical protein